MKNLLKTYLKLFLIFLTLTISNGCATTKPIVFKIHTTNKFRSYEVTKLREALKIAEIVLNSPEFKKRFLLLKLEQTYGFSNESIYNLLMSGIDIFQMDQDSEIDLYLTMYYNPFVNTVAYTRMDTIKIWYNRKYFARANMAQVAGTMIHEYMHNLGFLHSKDTDYSSVPYAVGDLVQFMVMEYLIMGELIVYKPESLLVPYNIDSNKKFFTSL